MTQGRFLHITLPKCGSQWVRDVLTAPALTRCGALSYSGITVDLLRDAMPPTPVNGFSGPIYGMDRWEWQVTKSPRDKAIVVVRDPRDRLISHLFSVACSHAFNPWVEVLRKRLLTMSSTREWISDELEKVVPYTRFYRSWSNPQDDSVLLVRYEDLIKDEHGEFARIVEWAGWAVPGNVLRRVVNQLSFAQRSNRLPGDTDIFSHHRKGIAGDWKNHFDRDLGQLWEQCLPGFLQAIGYEDDSDWWRRLPEQEVPTARGSLQGLPDEYTVLRKRNKLLEQQLREKEAVIQKLVLYSPISIFGLSGIIRACTRYIPVIKRFQ